MGDHLFCRIDAHLLSAHTLAQALEAASEAEFHLPKALRFFVIAESLRLRPKKSFFGAQRNKRVVTLRKARVDRLRLGR